MTVATTFGLAGSAFSPFFRAGATPIDYSADRLLNLSDLRQVLMVESGGVDLFAVRLEDGRPTGRWNFLCRIGAGALLLGSPRGPQHSIVGRPVLGTRVCHVPVAWLQRLSSANLSMAGSMTGAMVAAEPPPEDRAEQHATAVQQLIHGLELGVLALAQALRQTLPPRDFVPLSHTGPTPLEKGQAARSVDGVQWVTVEDGAVEMPEGISGHLTAGAEFCVTERDWLVASTNTARLRARPTRDVLADGTLWVRWLTHATRFLYAVDRRLERRDSSEHEALERRAERDAGTVAATAQGIDAVLRDAGSRVQLADVIGDPPALAAARLVAAREGFKVVAPPTSGGFGGRVAPLRAIALASGISTRQVRLDHGWWRRELGPMVGFRNDDDTPVALLPAGRRYVLAQPGESKVVPVTAAVAGTLANRGVAFYRPIPRSVRGVAGLLRYGMFRSRADLWRLLTLGTLIACLGLLVPAMTGTVLGTFVQNAQRDLIVQGSLLVIGSAFVAAALSIVQNVAALRLAGRSAARIQAGVWTRLLSLPPAFFGKYSTAELGTTVLGVSSAQETISGVMTTAALGLFAGAANLILVYFYDFQLALVATGLVAFTVLFCAVAGYYEVRLQRRLYEHERRLSSRVFQLLTAVPKLRVAAAENRAFGVWSAEFRRGRTIAASSRRVQNLVTTFNAGVPLVSAVFIFALVGGPLNGRVSTSSFLAFFAAFSLLMAAVLQFTSAAITAMSVVPMLEKLRPILQAEPEANVGKADPGELSGKIDLSRVSFRYGQDGPLILDDIDLSVEPGELVAIVGPTGSGKSTLLRLLLGFEKPTSGTVLYDGQDLGELDVGSVRRQCGVVLQNGSLLAGDIKANIIGSTDYTVDDAWEAAQMAGIDEDIRAMPMGMNTVLSDGTNTLSGGQRQRIMIARSLISRPRIVFFDEATSALDNPTQRVVAESTRQLNATRIVIAHRLSTITDADKIVVLDRGRIVQQGKYKDLLSDKTSLFAKLATRQM